MLRTFEVLVVTYELMSSVFIKQLSKFSRLNKIKKGHCDFTKRTMTHLEHSLSIAGVSRYIISLNFPLVGMRETTSNPGSTRKNIRLGDTVDIVQKRDQRTGKLTRGVVKDILTNSPSHPHGIKVRLQTGQVGRVQAIIKVFK